MTGAFAWIAAQVSVPAALGRLRPRAETLQHRSHLAYPLASHYEQLRGSLLKLQPRPPLPGIRTETPPAPSLPLNSLRHTASRTRHGLRVYNNRKKDCCIPVPTRTRLPHGFSLGWSRGTPRMFPMESGHATASMKYPIFKRFTARRAENSPREVSGLETGITLVFGLRSRDLSVTLWQQRPE
jgi:hypothetical protein